MSTSYGLELDGPARRALESRLPPTVAAAVWEFCDGVLREEPYRVGKPLRGSLEGLFSARRGAYRVIYQVNETAHVVEVLQIGHRTDVYRRR